MKLKNTVFAILFALALGFGLMQPAPVAEAGCDLQHKHCWMRISGD